MFVTSAELVFVFRDSAFLQILKQVSNGPLFITAQYTTFIIYQISVLMFFMIFPILYNKRNIPEK